MLCNTAMFKDDPDNLIKPISQRQSEGDASETAILKCMEATVSGLLKRIRFYLKEIVMNSRSEVCRHIEQ